MLTYNEIKERKYIVLDNEPYEVLDAHIFRKQQRKPVNQTKLRHLITGRVIEYTFQQSDKVHEANIEKETAIYLYQNPKKNEFWFSYKSDPKNRFSLDNEAINQKVADFVPENKEVELVLFVDQNGDEQVIDAKLPIKVELVVKEAPPAVKGNTATGGDKRVVLETGLQVTVPLFINEGDIVRVNTETGEYVERVEKA